MGYNGHSKFVVSFEIRGSGRELILSKLARLPKISRFPSICTLTQRLPVVLRATQLSTNNREVTHNAYLVTADLIVSTQH